MKRTVWAAVAVMSALSGCSSDPAESASATSSSPTTTSPTSTSPTSTSPTISAPAPAAPPAPVPPAPVQLAPVPPAPVDMPAPVPDAAVEESPDADVYLETCEQFFAAIDGLAATGAVTREQAATGIADQLQSNPDWATIPAGDQPEILRGLEAAGNGAC